MMYALFKLIRHLVATICVFVFYPFALIVLVLFSLASLAEVIEKEWRK